MKFIILTLNTILIFSLPAMLSFCNEQNTSHIANNVLTDQDPIIATGDTVSETHDSILVVFQASNNDFWFGSNGHGVYRYDGKNLIHFTKKNGLCHNQIRGIQEDTSGNIYFTTDRGINKFDGHTFTTLKITKSNLPNGGWKLQPHDLWFQGAQDSGVVYRYDGTGLFRLVFPATKAGDEFISRFPRSEYPNMTFSPYDVYSIFKDSKENIWFGTNMGVCRYDGKTFAWISEKELEIDAVAFHVRSTIEDKNGKFWFSNTMHCFDVYLNESPESKRDANEKGSVNFKKEKGISSSKEHDAADFAYFMSGLEDSTGNLWLATYGNGV
ncbi:MAG: PUR family DNA/RNA-binding protein [Bacteroidota bacterium]|nr:PUR family DNA/RNA-binding protein [Bacteroidota bacterium]